MKNIITNIIEKFKNKKEPMKEKTLNQAIKDIISDFNFIDTKSFSAFDITESIREDVNEKRYRIEGYLVEDIAYSGLGPVIYNTQFIPHRDVKKSFYSMFSDGEIDLQELTNGTPYRTFGFYSSYDTSSASLSSNAVGTSNKPTYNIDILKLYEYIDNRPNKTATLKQIQSRFKNCGMTCEQILDYIDQQNALYIAYTDLKYNRVDTLSKTKIYV